MLTYWRYIMIRFAKLVIVGLALTGGAAYAAAPAAFTSACNSACMAVCAAVGHDCGMPDC